MTFRYDSKVRATCGECGYSGSPWALELHSCDVQAFGGRHEDWPCCGCGPDGCQTRPEHTADYWRQVMASGQSRFAFEPGSPEWHDAADMDARYADYDGDEDACRVAGMHGQDGSGTDREGVYICDSCGGEYVDAYTDDDDGAAHSAA